MNDILGNVHQFVNYRELKLWIYIFLCLWLSNAPTAESRLVCTYHGPHNGTLSGATDETVSTLASSSTECPGFCTQLNILRIDCRHWCYDGGRCKFFSTSTVNISACPTGFYTKDCVELTTPAASTTTTSATDTTFPTTGTLTTDSVANTTLLDLQTTEQATEPMTVAQMTTTNTTLSVTTLTMPTSTGSSSTLPPTTTSATTTTTKLTPITTTTFSSSSSTTSSRPTTPPSTSTPVIIFSPTTEPPTTRIQQMSTTEPITTTLATTTSPFQPTTSFISSTALEATTNLWTVQTPNQSTSLSKTGVCSCSCTGCTTTFTNKTLEEKIEELQADIKVHKASLSSHRRKHTSAYDSRTSSHVIGFIISVTFCLCMAGLVFSDFRLISSLMNVPSVPKFKQQNTGRRAVSHDNGIYHNPLEMGHFHVYV